MHVGHPRTPSPCEGNIGENSLSQIGPYYVSNIPNSNSLSKLAVLQEKIANFVQLADDAVVRVLRVSHRPP